MTQTKPSPPTAEERARDFMVRREWADGADPAYAVECMAAEIRAAERAVWEEATEMVEQYATRPPGSKLLSMAVASMRQRVAALR